VALSGHAQRTTPTKITRGEGRMVTTLNMVRVTLVVEGVSEGWHVFSVGEDERHLVKLRPGRNSFVLLVDERLQPPSVA
jgi:hypothetical protein